MTDTAKLIAQADDWLASEYDVVPLTLVKSLRAALKAAEAERDAHRGTILILTGSLKRSEQTVEGERQNREAAEAELERERTRGIDHKVYEMVCEERDALEAEVQYLREGLELIARGAHTNPPEAISALAYARLNR